MSDKNAKKLKFGTTDELCTSKGSKEHGLFIFRQKTKTENAFSPTLPEMLFDRKKNHKILQNTNAEVVANAMLVKCQCNASAMLVQ